MARKSWASLPPDVRKLITAAVGIEMVLKIAALIDVVRRQPARIRGSKRAWIAAIVLINSAGAVPIAYFFKGRKKAPGLASLP